MLWPFNKIRDFVWDRAVNWLTYEGDNPKVCLLYTSDAADDQGLVEVSVGGGTG